MPESRAARLKRIRERREQLAVEVAGDSDSSEMWEKRPASLPLAGSRTADLAFMRTATFSPVRMEAEAEQEAEDGDDGEQGPARSQDRLARLKRVAERRKRLQMSRSDGSLLAEDSDSSPRAGEGKIVEDESPQPAESRLSRLQRLKERKRKLAEQQRRSAEAGAGQAVAESRPDATSDQAGGSPQEDADGSGGEVDEAPGPSAEEVEAAWFEYTDNRSGRTFYYNKVTKKKTWRKPQGLQVTDAVEARKEAELARQRRAEAEEQHRLAALRAQQRAEEEAAELAAAEEAAAFATAQAEQLAAAEEAAAVAEAEAAELAEAEAEIEGRMLAALSEVRLDNDGGWQEGASGELETDNREPIARDGAKEDTTAPHQKRKHHRTKPKREPKREPSTSRASPPQQNALENFLVHLQHAKASLRKVKHVPRPAPKRAQSDRASELISAMARRRRMIAGLRDSDSDTETDTESDSD